MDGKAFDTHENAEAENQGSFTDDNITHPITVIVNS